jgi:N-formylmaleamate deformylase
MRTTFRLPKLARLLICLTLPLLQANGSDATGIKDAASAPAAFDVVVKGSGRPMILIPGLGCGGDVWDDAVSHFQSTYQCHVITLAGFAGTTAIEAPFLQQVRDGLRDYIRDRKLEKPVLIGHSLGGFLGFWMGVENPELVGPIIAVDGVPYYPALNDANVTPDLQRPVAEKFRQFLREQTPESFATMNKANLSRMITDPAKLKKVADQANKSDPKAVGQAIYELMTTDLRSQLPAIQAPVLLIAATDSQAAVKEQKRQTEAYLTQMKTVPKHKVAFARKSRHFIHLDQPEFFIREVQAFLKANPQ